MPSSHTLDAVIRRAAPLAARLGLATGEVFAPDGFVDLEAGILRINPLIPQPGKWQAKAETYRARWPWLQIVEDAPVP